MTRKRWTLARSLDEATRREGGKVSVNRAQAGELVARWFDVLVSRSGKDRARIIHAAFAAARRRRAQRLAQALVLGVLLAAGPAGAQVLEENAPGVTTTGRWCPSGVSGASGGLSLFSCGTGTDTLRWPLPAGSQALDLTWRPNANRGPAIPVRVLSGTTVLHARTVDMRQPAPNGWLRLGTFSNATAVELASQGPGQGQEASADALRVTLQPPPPSATVTVQASPTRTVTPSPVATVQLCRFRLAYDVLGQAVTVEAFANDVPVASQGPSSPCGPVACVEVAVPMLPLASATLTLRARSTVTGLVSGPSNGATVQCWRPAPTSTPTPRPTPPGAPVVTGVEAVPG